MSEHLLYIGGTWRPAHSGATDEVVEPATGARLDEVASSDAADVDDAVAAARGAFAAWSDTTPSQRFELLSKVADAVEADMPKLQELEIRNVLVAHVSPHTVRTIEEHDVARRVMFAARNDGALPRSYHPGLLQVHDRKPFAASTDDIDTLAAEVSDANFRIMTAEDGIHVFNGKEHKVSKDAFSTRVRLPGSPTNWSAA